MLLFPYTRFGPTVGREGGVEEAGGRRGRKAGGGGGRRVEGFEMMRVEGFEMMCSQACTVHVT